MNVTKGTSESPAARIAAVEKRVILSMGGKGGAGKNSGLASAHWRCHGRSGERRERSRLDVAIGQSNGLPDRRELRHRAYDFTYWRESEQALSFQQKYSPLVLQMDYRLPVLENATRNHGVTLGTVASRLTDAPELQKASLVMRAQSYRRCMFAEFDKVKDLLLP